MSSSPHPASCSSSPPPPVSSSPAAANTAADTSHSVHTCLPVYTQAPTGSTSVGLTLYCQYT
eukprot:3812931-Prymnesium_polylepis.1